MRRVSCLAFISRLKSRIDRLHVKIRNQRLDFVRKEAAHLARSYDVVAVEDIDLRAMGQALKLGKNLHDNGFGMFRDILSEKLLEKGSVLVKVPRSYASTKTCHCCGNRNPGVVLGVSRWTCPVWGADHDRDENAAINIREKGKEVFPEYFANLIKEEEKVAKKAAARKAKCGRKKKAA